MRKFDLERLKGRVAVNCKSKEDANAFLEYLHHLYIKWNSGSSLTDKSAIYDFQHYGDATCFYTHNLSSVQYSKYSWYINHGYTVLDLSEIEIFEPTQQPTPKNNFKEYGFEADFEGEILKFIVGRGVDDGIATDRFLGWVKLIDKNEIVMIEWWSDGICRSGIKDNNYNLTPIKKPWYAQEENFEKHIGKLIINKFGEIRQILSIDNNKVNTSQQNMYHDTLISQEWRLVTEEDTTKLIY